jgi:hypothetical protein
MLIETEFHLIASRLCERTRFVTFPLQVLLSNGRLAGYVMKRVPGASNVEVLFYLSDASASSSHADRARVWCDHRRRQRRRRNGRSGGAGHPYRQRLVPIRRLSVRGRQGVAAHRRASRAPKWKLEWNQWSDGRKTKAATPTARPPPVPQEIPRSRRTS